MNIKLDSTLLIAILTALPFSFSTAHYHGYLSKAKLDSDIMERSFHQVVYDGLILSFFPMILCFVLIATALWFYSHALVPVYFDYVRGSIKPKRRIIKLKNYWVGKRVTPKLELEAKAKFNRAFIISIVVVLFLAGLIYFERKGENRAEAVLKQHFERVSEAKNLIGVEINKKYKELRFLGCGNKNCAGIEADTNKIYYFPQSLGFSFTYVIKNNSDEKK